jgi:hypothetical protein
MTRRERLKALGGASAIALVAVVAGRLVVLANHPAVSDVTNYEGYTAVVVAMVADKLALPVPTGVDSPGDLSRASNNTIVEYPPLAIAFMAATGFNVADDDRTYPDAYADQYRAVMLLIDLVVLVILFVVHDRFANPGVPIMSPTRAVALYGLGGLAFAYLIYDRLDLVVGALLLLALLVLICGWWRTSFVLLTLAIGFKAVPIVLVPLWILGSLPSRLQPRSSTQLRPLVRLIVTRSLFMAAATAVWFVPFALVVGGRAVDFVRFNALRGVQVESVLSSILLAGQPLGAPVRVAFQFGALEVRSTAAPVLSGLSPLLVLLAGIGATAGYAHAAWHAGTGLRDPVQSQPARTRLLASAEPQRFVAATLLVLLVTIVLSKVLSPQYLLWLLPIVPAFAVDSVVTRRFQLGFLAACFLSAVIYPILYDSQFQQPGPDGGFLAPGPLGALVLLLRNAILVVLVLLLLKPVMKNAAFVPSSRRPLDRS